MVPAAEQDEVVEIGRAAVEPVMRWWACSPRVRLHPGARQCRSRCLSSRYMWVGTVRVRRTKPDRHPVGVLDDDLADRVTGEPTAVSFAIGMP